MALGTQEACPIEGSLHTGQKNTPWILPCNKHHWLMGPGLEQGNIRSWPGMVRVPQTKVPPASGPQRGALGPGGWAGGAFMGTATTPHCPQRLPTQATASPRLPGMGSPAKIGRAHV